MGTIEEINDQGITIENKEENNLAKGIGMEWYTVAIDFPLENMQLNNMLHVRYRDSNSHQEWLQMWEKMEPPTPGINILGDKLARGALGENYNEIRPSHPESTLYIQENPKYPFQGIHSDYFQLEDVH